MKIAIVGAGVAGLTAGYRLAKQGHEVEIFEASDHVGGLAAGFPIAGTTLERYYHHIFTSDTNIRGLVDELGIRESLHWLPSQMGLSYKGKLYPFGTPSQILKLPILPFWERILFGFQGLYLGLKDNWKPYESITTYDWLKKYCSPTVLKIIWEPLLKGKFDRYYDKVAMAWFWARVHTRFSSRKGAKETLGYFKGGFETFHESLADAARKAGVKIQLNQPINRVITKNNEFKGIEVNKIEKIYDKLIFAAATPIFLKPVKIFHPIMSNALPNWTF